jgi:PAS domain S-box-containing protein
VKNDQPVIFIVEDDKTLNLLIQKALQREGLATESAFKGSEALERVTDIQNPVLLLDYFLPDMSAEEFIKTLINKKLNIPFVIITGHGETKSAVDMMKLGARDYITKTPNLIDILIHKINSIVHDLELEKKLMQAKDALMASERKYRKLFDLANDAIFVADAETGDLTFANKKAQELIGLPFEEIIGLHQSQLHPKEDAEKYRKIFEQHIQNGTAISEDVFLLNKDKKKIPVEISASITEIGGKKVIQGIFRDITDRKLIEKQLKTSLKEKEILFRELHHRTKNNMQVISSLLNIQSAFINNEQVSKIFRETQSRIRSISLVHEKLYQSEDLSNINLSDYIKDLANTLLSGYRIDSEQISLEFDADDVLISIDTAISCGLITNEIITNSLKYAFGDNGTGSIKVVISAMGDSNIELRIGDNGIGLPDGFNFDNTKTLGLKLVKKLAENQLRGTIDIIAGMGSQFVIKFNNNYSLDHD